MLRAGPKSESGHLNPPSSQEQTRWRILPFPSQRSPLDTAELLHARFVTHRFSRHYHHGYAFGIILNGAMRYRYLGENVTAAAGQINLVEPGEIHDGHAAMPQGWEYRMIYLQPEALLVASSEFTASRLPAFGVGKFKDPDLARQLLWTLTRLMEPSTPALESETLLLQILARIIKRHGRNVSPWKRRGKEPKAVAMAKDFIHASYNQDLRLADLGYVAGLSPFHLARVFQRTTGLPPHAYLMQLRLEQVKSLLAGPARLADLAQETGFADQSHLTRSFKAQYGITPGAYRKILQNS